jgi:mevalonate pyrophosphate decarboxylase
VLFLLFIEKFIYDGEVKMVTEKESEDALILNGEKNSIYGSRPRKLFQKVG